MANQPKTAQEWAWNYFKSRLAAIPELFGLSENLPKITTFADLKEGVSFIRFPWIMVENGELIVFKHTELYKKILAVRKMYGSGGYYNAVRMTTGSLHEIPDNEPVIEIN